MSVPERIVEALLESDPEMVDPKDFLSKNSDDIYNTWEQVGGDVGWWTYGGTFHNLGLGMMVHVPGLEAAGIKDIDSWDVELTPEELATITAKFPVQIDPELPEYGDDNEEAREHAVEAAKVDKAALLSDARKMSVYRWTDDHIEDFDDEIPGVLNATGMSEEDWLELTLGQKWDVIGGVLGYSHFDDYPDAYTRAEIQAYLTPRKAWGGDRDQG